MGDGLNSHPNSYLSPNVTFRASLQQPAIQDGVPVSSKERFKLEFEVNG